MAVIHRQSDVSDFYVMSSQKPRTLSDGTPPAELCNMQGIHTMSSPDSIQVHA